MIEKKEVTCIICPQGCTIDVILEDGKIVDVQNYGCKRGIAYAKAEVTHPTRILTSTVDIINEKMHRLPVRTKDPIPKELLKKAMFEINNIKVSPPIKMNQIIKEDIAGSGVPLIASRSWK